MSACPPKFGGFGGIGSPRGGSAKIQKGKFKAALASFGKVIIAATFGRQGTESRKITSELLHGLKACSTTVKYSTVG
jgi:hypothetical protein